MFDLFRHQRTRDITTLIIFFREFTTRKPEKAPKTIIKNRRFKKTIFRTQHHTSVYYNTSTGKKTITKTLNHQFKKRHQHPKENLILNQIQSSNVSLPTRIVIYYLVHGPRKTFRTPCITATDANFSDSWAPPTYRIHAPTHPPITIFIRTTSFADSEDKFASHRSCVRQCSAKFPALRRGQGR